MPTRVTGPDPRRPRRSEHRRPRLLRDGVPLRQALFALVLFEDTLDPLHCFANQYLCGLISGGQLSMQPLAPNPDEFRGCAAGTGLFDTELPVLVSHKPHSGLFRHRSRTSPKCLDWGTPTFDPSPPPRAALPRVSRWRRPPPLVSPPGPRFQCPVLPFRPRPGAPLSPPTFVEKARGRPEAATEPPRGAIGAGAHGTACLIPQGRLSALLAVPLYHRSRRAPEDAEASASESMQDESALASLDLAGLESLRSICSSTALTELLADFRVRRPASVSSAWRTRWCCG